MSRYYFDYNVYDKILKERIKINNEIMRGNDIFLSVAHIEEYYKAYKNDINDENRDFLENMKKVMIGNSKKRIILNPAKNSRIHAKAQTFDECYDIVQRYDTREIIENVGEIINKLEKHFVENLRKEDSMVKFNSKLNTKEIWKRPEVLDGIAEFSNYYQNYNIRNLRTLIPVYGLNGAKIGISALPRDFELQKDCFKNAIPNFNLLECVIEYLHKLLCACGFHRDRQVRKTISGIHDVSHSIYATYCNFFVTLDYNFRERVEAIYYYLGLETKLLSFDDLREKGIVLNQ